MNYLTILQFFLSADGQTQINEEIQKLKRQYGEKWIDAFKTDFPDLIFLIELILFNNFEDAILKLKAHLSDLIDASSMLPMLKQSAKFSAAAFVDGNRQGLFTIYTFLKNEMEKKT